MSELRGEGGDAVANDPGRLVSTAGNQRRAWWGEAWRGFEDSPLLGQGAGGFALVHLQERRNSDDALATREPHDTALRFLSGTGLVGFAFAALLGAVVWGVLRAAPGGAPEIGLPLAVLAAFALQAAIDWSWAIPALTVPALGGGRGGARGGRPGARPAPPPAPAASPRRRSRAWRRWRSRARSCPGGQPAPPYSAQDALARHDPDLPSRARPTPGPSTRSRSSPS